MQGLNYITLTESINAIESPTTVLQQLFFPQSTWVNLLTDTVEFDIERGGEPIAPFVGAYDEAAIIKAKDFTTKTITIPKIRLKSHISSAKLNKSRPAGKPVYMLGGAKPTDARKEWIGKEQARIKAQITNRIEWMIAQQLKGTMAVSADNISFTLDFGMPSANKVSLTDTACWGESAANIINNVRDWSTVVSDGCGKVPTLGLLGANAAKAFIQDASLRQALRDNNVAAGRMIINGLDYLGKVMDIDWYCRSEKYQDRTGAKQPFIHPNACVLHAASARKTMYWGVVDDEGAQQQMAVPFFSKQWTTEDPSGMWVLGESNPFPLFQEVDSLLYAVVIEE